jgi:hypothetical protein
LFCGVALVSCTKGTQQIVLHVKEDLDWDFSRIYDSPKVAIKSALYGGQKDQQAFEYFQRRLSKEGLSFVPLQHADTVISVLFGPHEHTGWFSALTGNVWRSFSIAICSNPKAGLEGGRVFQCSHKRVLGRVCRNFDPQPIYNFVFDQLKKSEPNERPIPTAAVKNTINYPVQISCG